jgi:hypothetical protein
VLNYTHTPNFCSKIGDFSKFSNCNTVRALWKTLSAESRVFCLVQRSWASEASPA